MSRVNFNRSLCRGLKILATLNGEGEHSVASIARDVRLPRTTTHRVLSTLVAEGFVARDAVAGSFRVTAMVRDLFDTFDETSLLVQAAKPLVSELGQRVIWPVTIATLSGTSVLLRQTTDDTSPLAVTHFAPGYRMPLSESASGLVLLAFSPPHQQQMLVDLLYQPSTAHEQPIPRAELEQRIARTHKLGYAFVVRPGRFSKRCSLAVPVQASEDAMVALVIRFAGSAVTRQVVLEKFVPELRRTAVAIVGALKAQQANRKSRATSREQPRKQRVGKARAAVRAAAAMA